MFQRIKYQLLLSYLAVFAILLGIFSLAVRVVFTRSLSQKIIESLTILGQSAIASTEFHRGHFKVEDDFPIKEVIIHHQALQWFDSQGHLVDQKGEYILTLPLSRHQAVQTQKTGKFHIRSITLPIIDSTDGRLIGYARASQSLEAFDETLVQLDWGLGSGVFITLVLSSLGGLWLSRKAMEPIELSFQQLKQFTADASHELRSPLMAITTNAAVALEYPQGMRPTDAKKFRAIANAADQMTRLTEDLLLLARFDQIQSPQWESVNLEEILHHLVHLYEPQADGKQIHLKADLTKPLRVLGDSAQLTRIFANLIDNALQYTPTGGLIEIQTHCVGQQLYISVKDTGIGMTPEQLQHVFERFWQADQARSYQSKGFGLGLAIAQSLVQNHGGSLTVTSQQGVGSCFTVRLPAYH